MTRYNKIKTNMWQNFIRERERGKTKSNMYKYIDKP